MILDTLESDDFDFSFSCGHPIFKYKSSVSRQSNLQLCSCALLEE